MIDRRARLIGGYAVFAALAAVIVSPLLASAYVSTNQGDNEIDSPPVSWWAKPALRHAGSLLTWNAPDRAYATYVQVLALLFPAVLLSALATRRRRRNISRVEAWGWRIALAGYALAGTGLLAAGVLLVPGHADSPALNPLFLGVLVPGMALSVIGSTVLGIALLRSGYQPRATAWLLALAIPLLGAGNILGHNSLGMVPLMAAWGLAGRSLRRVEPAPRHAPVTTALTDRPR